MVCSMQFDDDDDDLPSEPSPRARNAIPLEPMGAPDAPELPTFETTYRPSRHEEGWLLESLGDFFADEVLTDLLFPVRGGKEATVYCCRGGPALDGRLVAAKIYRPRKHRELRNDAIYREGRGLLDHRGNRQRARDTRMARAVRRGTRAGKEATHVSWVMHEFTTLRALYSAGGSVPEPISATRNGILMGFVGDEDGAGPTLDRARFDRDQGEQLLAEALRNVELLLALGWVHGDLSPYNLMLWEGELVVIDLPQVCDVLGNPHALGLYLRDVERICRFFDRNLDPRAVADDIWARVFDTEDGVPDTPIASVSPFLFEG
jgi:RIO kinase 1